MKKPGMTRVYLSELAFKRSAASSQYWILGSTDNSLCVAERLSVSAGDREKDGERTYSGAWMKEYSLGINLSVEADAAAASIRLSWDWLVSSETRPIAEMIVCTLWRSSSAVMEGMSL